MKIYLFKTESCRFCKPLVPVFDRLKKEGYPAEIIDETRPELFNKFGISSVPTVVIEKNGEIEHRITGTVSEQSLLATINSLN